MNKFIYLLLCLFLFHSCHASIPHSSISHTLHTHHHLTTLSHIVNQSHVIDELLDGARAPQEITPGIRVDPNAEPGLTLFAPTNSAFDSASHLSHVDLLYHILPISLSLKTVNNWTTTYWVRSMSIQYNDVQIGIGQVMEIVVVPKKDSGSSAYIIFGTPYSPHSIAHITSSIPCSNGILHLIDTVLLLPSMTSHVMKELSETYEHRSYIEELLKERKYQQEKESNKDKKEKEEQEIHHHDRTIRHGIMKYAELMQEYGFMRTVDRFRGITMFVPASTIESNIHHYSSNTLSIALLHHIIPGPPIYSFANLLDGAMTRTVIMQGISGPVTLTIQRHIDYTPVMDTSQAITVMLNGHVVNPIPSITRNGVIYVVDSCLPDTQSTVDKCNDIDTTSPLPMITSDEQSIHDMKQQLHDMEQSIDEQKYELKQRQREMQHDYKEREMELRKQYEERYGQQPEQQQQREQPQQPQQSQQGDWSRYVPDYNKFIPGQGDYTKYIPGHEGKQQPSPPHIIHINIGHHKSISIITGSDGMIITKEYQHGCDKDDMICHNKKCICDDGDKECKEECDMKRDDKGHEHDKDKKHEHDKDKECVCDMKDETCRDECDKKHKHEHDMKGYDDKTHQHDKHGEKCDKEGCEKDKYDTKHDQHDKHDKHDEHEQDEHDTKHDKHDTTHHDDKCDDECQKHKHVTKHDKHNHKYDTKSTSDAAIMMIVPELDRHLYEDDEDTDHTQQQQQHHQHMATQWTMILTVGILGALGLGCIMTGYCCLHFQTHPTPGGMGEYATASETTTLLSKSSVPPVRNDMIDSLCSSTHSITPIPSHLNGYHSSPNGCTHPILGDNHSDAESERYIQQNNGHMNGNGKSKGKKNGHGNGQIPRSDAVNIQTKTSPTK